MTLKKPINENYTAIVVQIKTLVPIANCDNVVHAVIMGNQVVVGKDTSIGSIGLYFPLETQLSEDYLKYNNLYRKTELNANIGEKGYFEENGRIRCVKFRGNKSEGLFMPLKSLEFCFNENPTKLPEIGDCFDELNGIEICRKYVVKKHNIPGLPGSKKNKNRKQHESKLIDNQFRFHQDTSMLYKNLHRINPTDIISITYKLHGTSGISSKILCKKKLKWYEKILKWIGLNIVDTVYDNIYSSRKVIKNEELSPNAQHSYDVDIWKLTNDILLEYLQAGMTFYYETIGYLPTGGLIQKDYDYGYEEGQFGIYIYRITYTNTFGKTFEFSAKQVQDFCKKNGLNAVPQLYYGYAKDLMTFKGLDYHTWNDNENSELWRNLFLQYIKDHYNEKDCFMSKNKVPEEGCVIRIENLDFEAYKQKSNAFYERETKLLDKGESNIEDDN